MTIEKTVQPCKPRLTKAQKCSRDLRAALDAADPWLGAELERKFIFTHMPRGLVLGADHLGARSRHELYIRMSPLQATNRFAEEYRKGCQDPAYEWGSKFMADPGALPEWSQADLEHIWLARQMSEALGLRFEHYIRAVFEAHREEWFRPPTPEEMHCPAALIAAMNASVAGFEIDEEFARAVA